jgi:hypothetical protein
MLFYTQFILMLNGGHVLSILGFVLIAGVIYLGSWAAGKMGELLIKDTLGPLAWAIIHAEEAETELGVKKMRAEYDQYGLYANRQ